MKRIKSAFHIIMDILESGEDVRLKNDMILTQDDQHHICYVMTRVKMGNKEKLFSEPEEILIKSDLPLNAFIDLCNEFSEDELFLLNANLVLNQMNKKRK